MSEGTVRQPSRTRVAAPDGDVEGRPAACAGGVGVCARVEERPEQRLARPGRREDERRLAARGRVEARPRHALAILAGHGALRAELKELVGILRGRARVVGGIRSPRLPGEVPLELHARYRTEEISTAFDLRTREGKLYLPQTGVVKVGDGHDALLVTVDESGKKKPSHLQYDDYAITPELFHWQSQASTRRDQERGRRHLSPSVTPIVFLRETDKDERGLACAYTCLGTALRVEDHGERPITIVWRLLDGPLPAEMLHRTRVAVA